MLKTRLRFLCAALPILVLGDALTRIGSDSEYGGRAMPRSVMMPVTNVFGVTSKAGFRTFASTGVMRAACMEG